MIENYTQGYKMEIMYPPQIVVLKNLRDLTTKLQYLWVWSQPNDFKKILTLYLESSKH